MLPVQQPSSVAPVPPTPMKSKPLASTVATTSKYHLPVLRPTVARAAFHDADEAIVLLLFDKTIDDPLSTVLQVTVHAEGLQVLPSPL